MSEPFRVRYPLRFAHCDPAGIAYYPRLLELCDAAIEDWTKAVLGVSRRTLHLEMKLALPTVDLRASFAAPARLGDLLDIEITVVRLGRSSIVLDAAVTTDGQDRFAITYTQVLTAMDGMKAEQWPPEWRERLTMQMEKETQA